MSIFGEIDEVLTTIEVRVRKRGGKELLSSPGYFLVHVHLKNSYASKFSIMIYPISWNLEVKVLS